MTREQIEASLTEIIARRRKGIVDQVPDGWVTSVEAANAIGLSEERMRFYLREAKELPVKSFRIQCGKLVRPVNHYFLGKKK